MLRPPSNPATHVEDDIVRAQIKQRYEEVFFVLIASFGEFGIIVLIDDSSERLPFIVSRRSV
jgi:hypothetical protein